MFPFPLGPTSPVLRGILFNLAALVLFTLMDALAKHLIQSGYPALQVVWTRYVGQTALIAVLIAPRLRSALATRRPVLHGARSVLQFASSFFFFVSLPFIPLASATAVADLNPVLITLGAALFLGERVGPRRLVAIALALFGAFLIIRPGSEVFSWAALLPLATACSYAAFALITRQLGASETLWSSLFYSALFGTVLSSALVPFAWAPVAAADLWGFAGIALLGTLGQVCLIRAFSAAPASVIAPFGYVGIVLATVWGLVFFGERPDGPAVLGALVIIGAGLYVWHREARAKRTGAP